VKTKREDQLDGADDDRVLCAGCETTIKAPRFVRPGAYQPRYCDRCRKKVRPASVRARAVDSKFLITHLTPITAPTPERVEELKRQADRERVRSAADQRRAAETQAAVQRIFQRTRDIQAFQADAAARARRVLQAAPVALAALFRRSKGGVKVGVTADQGHAWILNEFLDRHEETGEIHKQAGGRIIEKDPTTFAELVTKAHTKLRATPGALYEARGILEKFRRVQDSITPLSGARYDAMIGPSNRKGGRSIPLVRAGAPPERDTGKTTRGGVRTAARKVRYGPGDKYGEG
jgi:hypothetical protein